MAATKQDFLATGINVRNNLYAVADQIKQNKLLDAKNQRLSRYNDPNVFEGANSLQSSQQTFQDYMWLASNGFEGEAKGLEKMWSTHVAQTEQKAQNNAFISLLNGEQKKLAQGFDLQNTDVGKAFGDIYKITPKPEKLTKPVLRQFGSDLYFSHQDPDTHEWVNEIIANNEDWNKRININTTPDNEAFYDQAGNFIGYYDKKNAGSVPKGSQSATDRDKQNKMYHRDNPPDKDKGFKFKLPTFK